MLNYMALSVCKQQAEWTFYVYFAYITLKAALNNRNLIYLRVRGEEDEMKYKSLFKVISVYSENTHFNNIFIFWLTFHWIYTF